MATLNYTKNAENKYAFNSLYLNYTSQDYSEFTGNNNEFDGGILVPMMILVL